MEWLWTFVKVLQESCTLSSSLTLSLSPSLPRTLALTWWVCFYWLFCLNVQALVMQMVLWLVTPLCPIPPSLSHLLTLSLCTILYNFTGRVFVLYVGRRASDWNEHVPLPPLLRGERGEEMLETQHLYLMCVYMCCLHVLPFSVHVHIHVYRCMHVHACCYMHDFSSIAAIFFCCLVWM